MKKRLDLIFCSVNRNKTNMDFEHFLQSLVKVAEAKFLEANPRQSLKALMDYHMLPLAAHIISKQENKGFGIDVEERSPTQLFLAKGKQTQENSHGTTIFEYDELVSILLRDVGKVLLDIYQIYFEHELKCGGVQSDQEILKTSQKNLFNFLKDFEICPNVVNKQAAYKIFADDSRNMPFYTPTGLDILTKVMNKESKVSQLFQLNKLASHIGKCFTFFRFLDLLVECSISAFSDPFFTQSRKSAPLVMAEMVCLLLERMELSHGFG